MLADGFAKTKLLKSLFFCKSLVALFSLEFPNRSFFLYFYTLEMGFYYYQNQKLLLQMVLNAINEKKK